MDKNTPYSVVFATDNAYSPFLAASIQSLVANTPQQTSLEVFILHTNISAVNQKNIASLAKAHITISFISMQKYIDSLGKNVLYETTYLSKVMYYRLFIPEIFTDKEKVLYIDCDTIICQDITGIFQYDDGHSLLAVVPDYGVRIRYYQKPRIHTYIDTVINIDVQTYFQSGVLLFYVQRIRETAFFEQCFNFIRKQKNAIFPDQDALNVSCKEKVLYLPWAYNLMWHIPFLEDTAKAAMPAEDKAQYEAAYAHPVLIHYSTSCKPWDYPELPLAEYFWQYAEQTPYSSMLQEKQKKSRQNMQHQVVRFYYLYAASCFWKVCTFLPFIHQYALKRHTKYRLMVRNTERHKRLVKNYALSG